jgi:hypothetical protein
MLRLVRPATDEDTDMSIIPANRRAGRTFTAAVVLPLVVLVLSPADLAAQGLPVQNGPMVPVALWWIGAFLLGLILAYGIMRNRSRTRAEKDLTERATKQRYAEEARKERTSGPV